MSAPVGPFFVVPHEEGSEGVDYLGLRAINLNMMNTLLPGINNVVSLVRPFSLMSWTCWRYASFIKETGQDAHPEKFRRFREKIETLFVWSHVQAGDATGLPGNQQRDSSADSLNFQFSSFSRTASFLDAALYGPSMKTQNGLGFLYAEGGFFKVTGAGETLAKAFDANLKRELTAYQYAFVASVDDIRIGREVIKGLVAGWLADVPGAAERRAFATQFYRSDEVGQPSPTGIRSAMLSFVVETLRENGPSNVAKVRRHMTCSPLPNALREHGHATTFCYAKLAWQMLQTRQAQRLGLEGLFGWVERCLFHLDARSVEDLVSITVDAMKRDSAGASIDDGLVRHGYEFFRRASAPIDELFAYGDEDPARADLFVNMERVEVAATDKFTDSNLALSSIALLLQCAALEEAFRHEPFAAARIDAGPPFRIPLGHWGKVVRNHMDMKLRDFLRKVIETFLISQHLGIAASRTRDERSRMRISIEDRGLTSLLQSGDKVLTTSRTPDRLGTAMALMANCGLISADSTLRHGGANVTYCI